MAFCPSADSSQSMKACPSAFFTFGCLSGFTRITPYWLKSFLSPSNERLVLAAVLEGGPRGAVGQHVGAHSDRRVDRRAHALAGLAVPGAGRRLGVDARIFPQPHLGLVGAAVVAARHEWR